VVGTSSPRFSAEEPVLLGAAMLGAVAAKRFADVPSAMAAMSQIGQTYAPAGGPIAALHEARYRAFMRLQSVTREIRDAERDLQ
jgi:D-ribulokinase